MRGGDSYGLGLWALENNTAIHITFTTKIHLSAEAPPIELNERSSLGVIGPPHVNAAPRGARWRRRLRRDPGIRRVDHFGELQELHVGSVLGKQQVGA